jgi:hypothetical protein
MRGGFCTVILLDRRLDAPSPLIVFNQDIRYGCLRLYVRKSYYVRTERGRLRLRIMTLRRSISHKNDRTSATRALVIC